MRRLIMNMGNLLLVFVMAMTMTAYLAGCHGDGSGDVEVETTDDGTSGGDGEVAGALLSIGQSESGDRGIVLNFAEPIPEASLSKAEGEAMPDKLSVEASIFVRDSLGRELAINNVRWRPDMKSLKINGEFPWGAEVTVGIDALGESWPYKMPNNEFDFDGSADGTADLAMYDGSLETSYVMLGEQILSLKERPLKVTLGSFPKEFGDVWSYEGPTSKNVGIRSIGDLDGDGIGTVVFQLNAKLEDVTLLWEGNDDTEPDASFAVTSKISDVPVPVGDINGDGNKDVLVRDNALDANGDPILDEAAFYYILGSTTGIGFDAHPWDLAALGFQFDTSSDPVKACGNAMGDFDGDGFGDVAGCLSYDSGYQEIGVGYGSEDISSFDNLEYSMINVLMSKEDMKAKGLASGDLNGDGVSDLVVAFATESKPREQEVRIYLNEKGVPVDGTVDSYSVLVSLENPALGDESAGAMVPGDLNGDGFDDLVITWMEDGDKEVFPVAYILFGRAAWDANMDPVNVTNLFANRMSRIEGPGGLNRWIQSSPRGDFDNDGYDDLAIVMQPEFGSRYTIIYRGSDSLVGFKLDTKYDQHVMIFYSK